MNSMKQMMKKILLSAVCLLLTGCVRYSGDVVSVLGKKLAEACALEVPRPVFNSTYYRYYAQPYVGRVASDRTSNVFSLNGTLFVMNLDAAAVINEAYYPSERAGGVLVEGASLVAETADRYTDSGGSEHTYVCRIYRSGQSYITVLSAGYAGFYAVSSKYEAPEIAGEMLYIARSLETDRPAVLRDFSSHSIISYQKKKLELFQSVIPENGRIEELFADNDTGSLQIGEDGDYAVFSDEPPEEEPEETALTEEEENGEDVVRE